MKKKVKQTMGERPVMIICAICCTPICAAYMIAAIIIGFMSNAPCSDQTTFIDPFLYLQIGGITFLASDLLTLCTRFTICKKETTEDFRPSKGQSTVSFLAVLYQTFWMILGCIIYNELDQQCADSSVGKMILSFVIIASILNCIECISITWSCSTKKKEEEPLLEDV